MTDEIQKSEKQEQIDFECIGQRLQKAFPNKFKLLKKMPLGNIFDAYSFNTKEERYIHEYKCRYDEDFDTYEDCYIEPEKYKNLKEWCNKYQDDFPGVKPLYICSVGEKADVIYIWDLSKDLEYNFYEHMWISTCNDYRDRYGLLWKDSCKLIWVPELNGYTMVEGPEKRKK